MRMCALGSERSLQGCAEVMVCLTCMLSSFGLCCKGWLLRWTSSRIEDHPYPVARFLKLLTHRRHWRDLVSGLPRG